MTVQQMQSTIEDLMSAHSGDVHTINYANQAIADMRTCLEYRDSASNDPIEAAHIYRIGYLQQPKSSVPDLSVFYVSREGGIGIDNSKLVVLNEQTAKMFPSLADFAFAEGILGRISRDELTRTVMV
jgi:hypothetical protein